MIEHIPEMLASGISSLKIEGRMKGINYLASVVKIYREAIDAYALDAAAYHVQPQWKRELSKISHRDYCTGFYLGDPDQVSTNTHGLISPGQLFLAKVLKSYGKGQMLIDVRNQMHKNDKIEIIPHTGPVRMDRVLKIMNENHEEVDVVNPGSQAQLTIRGHASPNDIIRKVAP